ncbi:choice-of-anchor Q domain-containing protein [Marinicella sediminis]|uniref:Choice-of-anchor Q domain-containing protein n=1 Tax=Marinicella sediminis TaxID=1792834 RepID=A0ABV7J7V0_9GAMM|nr:choice-of-anchor Q domain-containing protein [Marinicella sediminis]
MKSFNNQHSVFLICSLFIATLSFAGDTPFTNNDFNMEAAINSSAELMDVLSNDDSGITGNDYKEVVAVCDINASDQDCLSNGTNFSNAIGTVTVNGTGDNNNVLFTSSSSVSDLFEFKYVMENFTGGQGSAEASVTMFYYEVNTNSDSSTNNCTPAACTLRDAIAAGQAEAGASNVRFDRDFTGIIMLSSELTIDDTDLTIAGPGGDQVTVSGNDQVRVIDVTGASERVSLSGFTISNGLATGDGAGIRFNGSRDVLVENMRIIDNETSTNGGGIWFASASGTVRNTEISDNQAGVSGGGIGMIGSFGSDVLLENVTISGNVSADDGAGFFINSGNGQNITLRHVTSAFNNNGSNQIIGNQVGANGNINIESSLIVSNGLDLVLLANNNVVNNSIIGNYSGANLVGGNNLTEWGVALNPLAALNDTGLRVHSFEPGADAHNYVDDMIGNVGCGTVVPNDQIGTPRPEGAGCDAGAYEYIFIDEIFISGFE